MTCCILCSTSPVSCCSSGASLLGGICEECAKWFLHKQYSQPSNNSGESGHEQRGHRYAGTGKADTGIPPRMESCYISGRCEKTLVKRSFQNKQILPAPLFSSKRASSTPPRFACKPPFSLLPPFDEVTAHSCE